MLADVIFRNETKSFNLEDINKQKFAIDYQ